MKTVLIQLVSGVWVIGKIEYHNEEECKVYQPMTLEFAPTGNGQLQLGLLPYGYPVLQADPKSNYAMVFYSHAIAIPAQEPPPQILNAYTQATSSIELVPPGASVSNLQIAR